MELSFKLQTFEGPLDLLLHLIDKNKVNIYDIPIAMITDQYLEYVEAMQKEDLNLVSEFLVMAATLLDIKSRMLLPKDETEEGEEEDPRAELVEKLLEYKLFKAMSLELKDRQMDAVKSFYKKADIPAEVESYKPPVVLEEIIGDTTLTRLNSIFNDCLRRQEDKIDPVRSKFGKIEKEEVSIEDRLIAVREILTHNKEVKFRDLLLDNDSKLSIIVTFLVILEMIKTGYVTVVQNNTFDDIYITVEKDVREITGILEE